LQPTQCSVRDLFGPLHLSFKLQQQNDTFGHSVADGIGTVALISVGAGASAVTCAGAATCAGAVTCATSAGAVTSAGAATSVGAVTSAGTATSVGAVTCAGAATSVGAVTLAGAVIYVGAVTCVGSVTSVGALTSAAVRAVTVTLATLNPSCFNFSSFFFLFWMMISSYSPG
jgi:hypothetical protein